jgi:hypothetical protein
MTRSRSNAVPDLHCDPFGERGSPAPHRARVRILGCDVSFESNSAELIGLVRGAYSDLPRHRLAGAVPRLKIRLLLTSRSRKVPRTEPPELVMVAGAGLLGGATTPSSFVVLAPGQRAALVVVSNDMLRFPYHARYEILEFAVFTLASRVQRLVPLHAACVGAAGRGVLLMGESGSGKSTVSLLALQSGMDFLAEDSVFVEPASMRATGVANFVHVRADSLAWVGDRRERESIRSAPVIRRRSGVRKFEVDLRTPRYRLARRPLKIEAVLFLSAAPAAGELLRRLGTAELATRLAAAQPYAAGQRGWSEFHGGVRRAKAFELRRGRHPLESVSVLRSLLGLRA